MCFCVRVRKGEEEYSPFVKGMAFSFVSLILPGFLLVGAEYFGAALERRRFRMVGDKEFRSVKVNGLLYLMGHMENVCIFVVINFK